ncbi:MAG: anaerobic ribonucleoside-triphosphate reductase [Oscillospiraceae bacterium]
MISVNVTGGELAQEEIDYYVEAAQKRNPGKFLTAVDFEVDGEYVNASYHFSKEPFQRIRRITGYLVGTLDRFNNGKRAEEADRVKHCM